MNIPKVWGWLGFITVQAWAVIKLSFRPDIPNDFLLVPISFLLISIAFSLVYKK